MDSVKNYVRSRTTYAFRRAVRQVGMECRMWLRHRAAVRKAARFLGSSPLKLNLGCGANRKSGWVNIDFYHSSSDLQLDLREPWPFPEASVAYIYCEHVFEHFQFEIEVPHVLSEALRVLVPQGVFDIGVPDTEWPLRQYGNPDLDYWPFAATVHPETCETQLDHINWHFRQDEEHKYAWDEVTLTRSLERAGFVSIERRPFNPALDSEGRKTGTLYMRALKPRVSVS